MALVNITPVMTSNTTPSPYVVSASSEYSASFKAWNAFDNTTSSAWITSNGVLTGWIKVDFGTPTRLNAFSLCTRDGALDTEMPKSFILYGSNDDINYEQIINIDGQILWTIPEKRLYTIPSTMTFRYYRINILSNNGRVDFTCIGEINFWQDDFVTSTITNAKASMVYCLPKNTTTAMKSRQNDIREGLLGFADDSTNYGTLWLIDKTGKAVIPKAAMANMDTLFSGSAVDINIDYSLVDSIKKYKEIIVIGGPNGTYALSVLSLPVDKIPIGSANTNTYGLGFAQQSTVYWSIYLGFTSETTFKLGYTAVAGGWNAPKITTILGIK